MLAQLTVDHPIPPGEALWHDALPAKRPHPTEHSIDVRCRGGLIFSGFQPCAGLMLPFSCQVLADTSRAIARTAMRRHAFSLKSI